MANRGAGPLLERLQIQRADDDPEVFAVSTITRSSTTATVTTAKDHGLAANDWVEIAGADQSAYNGTMKVLTVPTATTFTYTVSGSPATPATNYITVTYVSDSQGGRRTNWRDLATVPAELIPLRGFERLQLAAIQSNVAYRFRVRTRTDLEPKQRCLWTPRWPRNASEKTLAINAVVPVDDGRQWLHLECSDVVAA